MTDHFAVLRQPRRPWLDPDKLKEKYQKLARSEHPDQTGRRTEAPPTFGVPTFGAATFGEINEAYRVLSDPRLRLQHLLNLEGAPRQADASPTSELTDLFSRTASVLADTDRVLEKLRAANSALSRSLLHQEILAVRQRADVLLAELEQCRRESIQELQNADKLWEEKRGQTIGILTELANRFGYLDRWIDQLRERQFQLENS